MIPSRGQSSKLGYWNTNNTFHKTFKRCVGNFKVKMVLEYRPMTSKK